MKQLGLALALVVIAGCGVKTTEGPAGIPEAAKRPNILLIVADDLGFSDLGAYGGEISTPTLDQLAASGMMLTNFHTSLTCAPTRAMLLTGEDNHVAGLGNMVETTADNQLGLPGYEGHLSPSIPTIAEQLQLAGYHTYLSGKWHLGTSYEAAPHKRGFDQTFGPIYGGGSHFSDRVGPEHDRRDLLYRENGELVFDLPEDFYSTEFFTSRAIQQIDSNLEDGKPFFAYVAYTAPHWPLQVPDEYLNLYQGKYDAGYDAIREARLARMTSLGVLDVDLSEYRPPDFVSRWADLDDAARLSEARNMEIYAAMVDYLDSSIARLLDYLERNGELDNTLIIFLSDNGAEAWSDSFGPPAWTPGQFAGRFDNRLQNRGRLGSFVFTGPGWSQVSNAPFSWYKGFTGEGGTRVPSIAVWPARIPAGQRSNALVSVSDWYHTIADAAGLPAKQRKSPTDSLNLMPLLSGKASRVRDENDILGMEMWGRQAVYMGDWKLVSMPEPAGPGGMQLYNLVDDPMELNDLSSQEPERLQMMQDAWQRYVDDNNVILPEGPFKIRPPVIPQR